MKKNRKHAILIILVAAVLFIMPYTREVEQYDAEDVQWELFHETERYKVFDTEHFHFREEADISDRVQKLHGQTITIKGFLYKETIGGETQYLLAENPQHVCAFCNHDEHGYKILLFPRKTPLPDSLQNEDYAEVSGTFLVSDSLSGFSPFRIQPVQYLKKLKKHKR